jgi:diacylglycerol kinase
MHRNKYTELLLAQFYALERLAQIWKEEQIFVVKKEANVPHFSAALVVHRTCCRWCPLLPDVKAMHVQKMSAAT